MHTNINNQYLRFIIRIILLLLTVVFFDQVCGAILKRFYFSQKSGSSYRTTYSIDSTKADILIFGSSRANHHYVPDIFENELNMSFYNTGRDGNSILYTHAIFKGIVKRYTPKLIILDLIPNELTYSKSSYERLVSLLPYYQDHPEIRFIIEYRSPFEKLKLLSAIYPYNSLLGSIGIGNLNIRNKIDKNSKGYLPLYGRITDTSFLPLETSTSPIDSNRVNAIKYFLIFCKTKNIRLILIQSPLYCKVTGTNSSRLFNELIKSYRADFWDYGNNDTFIRNPSLFQDIGHLNHDGAKIFSNLVVEKIKESLNEHNP